ncbi:MAG: hypothetical protein R6V73_10640 [Anaerolineales bacterium]
MPESGFEKTLIVWWRFGKEHGGEEFQVNPPEQVRTHLQKKIDEFRKTPADLWRWWQVDDHLIVELWDTSPEHTGPDTRIYYLLKCGLSIIENIHLPPPDENWKWCIRLSDFEYNAELGTWMMKDLFCDILVGGDNRTYHMFDLPDVAQALDVGLITPAETREILKRVDWVLTRIAKGEFPFPEVRRAQAACRQLGW